MTKKPRKADARATTPRAKQLAKALAVDLSATLPPNGVLGANDVLRHAIETTPASVQMMELPFEPGQAYRLVSELEANTLAGEAAPTIGDLFVKSVAAVIEVHPVKNPVGKDVIGHFQLALPSWSVMEDIHHKDLREIAGYTADLSTGGHLPANQRPFVLVADSARWGLSNLQLDLPPTASILFTLLAPAEPTVEDVKTTIRLQFRAPVVSTEAGLRTAETLVDLMTDVDWLTH